MPHSEGSPDGRGLQKWYDKNKADQLKDFLTKHAELEVRYEEAKALYKNVGWKILYIESLRDDHIKVVMNGRLH